MRIGRICGYGDKDFQTVKDQGLSFIEICLNDENETTTFLRDKDAVKERIKTYGIDVSSVGRWNHDINEKGALIPEKLEIYLSLVDAAIEVGAKTVVFGCNYDESVSLYKNYTCAIELFGKLLERAGGKIKVAVENCDWNNFIVSPEQWKVVLGEYPDLCLKYDCSHAYNRGDNYLDELSDWGDRIAHFHVKGTTHAGSKYVSDPPAGMDDIKWGSVFSILYARKYTGDLSIEPHSSIWRGEIGNAGVLFTRDYIRKFVF